MQKHAGVFRNTILLEEGVEKMRNIYKKFDRICIQDKSHVFNTEFVEMLELKILLENAWITMESANFRKESRGAHAHDDYNERNDDESLKHTWGYIQNGNIKLDTRSVVQNTLDIDEVNPIPLAKRVY